MKYSGFECIDCTFFKKGMCELKDESKTAHKIACRDFEA